MFISDPELIPDQAGARVGALYGLTKAEAEIAEAMAAGSDAAEIAKARGTSINTTRTQIKSMMSKIGATRRSEIVRAIAGIPSLDDAMAGIAWVHSASGQTNLGNPIIALETAGRETLFVGQVQVPKERMPPVTRPWSGYEQRDHENQGLWPDLAH
jgi:DNA-binding CsgD family transcriptional regulator